MDLFTHAALGAAAAAAVAPRGALRLAALTGALAGVLPDADQLIASDRDPLLTLEYHRHFTHALAIVPFAALLPAILVAALVRRRFPFVRLYAFSLVGYLLSPLLDACTSYGTHLLWPFAQRPIAWSIISIIDPIFTLLVGTALAFALLRRSPAWARAGVALATLVLGVGFVQHERAFAHAAALAASRGHVPDRLLVKPTLANMVVWRSLYVAAGRVHVDAIRIGLTGDVRVYPGETAALFVVDRDLELPPGSVLYRDVQRFVAFTDGLPVRHPARAQVIGDARYSMLPTSLEPLWGIVLDPASPDAHARFETHRDVTPAIRRQFIAMLLGRDLDPQVRGQTPFSETENGV